MKFWFMSADCICPDPINIWPLTNWYRYHMKFIHLGMGSPTLYSNWLRSFRRTTQYAIYDEIKLNNEFILATHKNACAVRSSFCLLIPTGRPAQRWVWFIPSNSCWHILMKFSAVNWIGCKQSTRSVCFWTKLHLRIVFFLRFEFQKGRKCVIILLLRKKNNSYQSNRCDSSTTQKQITNSFATDLNVVIDIHISMNSKTRIRCSYTERTTANNI